MLNRVELVGGLTKNPDLTFTTGGVALLQFTLALESSRYDSQAGRSVPHTDYIACTAWASLAEQHAEADYQPGDVLHVLGRLEQREIDKRDGTKEKKTRVIALVITPVRRRQERKPEPTF